MYSPCLFKARRAISFLRLGNILGWDFFGEAYFVRQASVFA